MAEVDPFLQPIPQKFASEKELRNYFEYLNRFLHDIWVRTGAGNDAVDRLSEGSTKQDVFLPLILNKVELGDPVTVDDTGFTADSTVLYADITLS